MSTGRYDSRKISRVCAWVGCHEHRGYGTHYCDAHKEEGEEEIALESVKALPSDVIRKLYDVRERTSEVVWEQPSVAVSTVVTEE
jgi:hypothetical protein